jgi:serine protease
MSGQAHVVRLGRRVMRQEARELVRRLAADPRIESIEPDAVMQPLAVPNDTMFAQQWHFHEFAGGINLPSAWDLSTGSDAIRIAIIDTGVLPHAELAARTIGGFDFIADTARSNDGDGRDGNAADPGDYGCNGSASSWHGTHVAGTIGAASNNGAGVTGINWVSRLVPVRVMGKCGGYSSDIIDGMRWAAGIDVPGVAANPYPVRVENLSLGGSGTCSDAFQSAVNDRRRAWHRGRRGGGQQQCRLASTQPASCSGVISVAATTRQGGRAGYSNFGAKVTIAAPGGGGSDAILSTLNNGSTTPGADSYAWFQGTSLATPHVSGVVSLMLSLGSFTDTCAGRPAAAGGGATIPHRHRQRLQYIPLRRRHRRCGRQPCRASEADPGAHPVACAG